jgi:hypothetical protein
MHIFLAPCVKLSAAGFDHELGMRREKSAAVYLTSFVVRVCVSACFKVHSRDRNHTSYLKSEFNIKYYKIVT